MEDLGAMEDLGQDREDLGQGREDLGQEEFKEALGSQAVDADAGAKTLSPLQPTAARMINNLFKLLVLKEVVVPLFVLLAQEPNLDHLRHAPVISVVQELKNVAMTLALRGLYVKH
ncbi:UNVERIFIED_CONTAM: hypothetical protein GTU68_041204, partial [Idotea baltica]|nr:hypothetical protein [Idotea baltica]